MPDPSLTRKPCAGLRAVVIDDDDAVAKLLVRTLEDLGMECVTFWRAEDALAWLFDNPVPDLLCVDVMLPQMSGLSFAREVRQRPRFDAVNILLITARAELSDALQATKLRARFLKKPFRLQELRTCAIDLVGALVARKRVMIVDDDDGIREALTTVVRDEGYEPLCARDGAEALHMLRGNARPDVVLLDIMMPGMDGLNVAQEMRCATSEMPPVVLVSARDGVGRDARRIGAFAHLQKPVNVEDVLSVIRRATVG